MPFLQHDGGGKSGDVTLAADPSDPMAATILVKRRQRQADKKFDVGEWKPQMCDEESSSSGSPEVADTPRTRVPETCFPPHNPDMYVSYTERARPTSLWTDDLLGMNFSTSTITDLANTFANLALPGSGSSSDASNSRFNYETENNGLPWPLDRTTAEAPVNRRASFCGTPSMRMDKIAYWEGVLPQRQQDTSAGYSSKVFLGGIPWDITETALKHAFRHFHPTKVEWPTSRGVLDSGVAGNNHAAGPRGYAYMTFETERRVRSLLDASRKENEDWYFQVSSRKMRKKVQVIPWCVSYSLWVSGAGARLEPRLTVFVGALHGMLTAEALALIMNNVFGGVIYAGIDTDRNKYPIGSGRVTFNNAKSYVRAVSAGFLDICTDKFSKRVQLDPYLEESMCSMCNIQQGPYFCREPSCFKYYCRSCWGYQHGGDAKHRPLMRNSKNNVNMSAFNASHNMNSTTNSTYPNNRLSGSDYLYELFNRNNSAWNPI